MISHVFFLSLILNSLNSIFTPHIYFVLRGRGHLHHISFILILFLFRRCGEGADRIGLEVFI